MTAYRETEYYYGDDLYDYSTFDYSAPSDSVTQTTPAWPSAPTALTAEAVSATQINLTWEDNATDETGYLLERSVDGVTWYPNSSWN